MFLFDNNIRPYLIIMLGIMIYIGSIALIPRFIQDHKEHLASAVWLLLISVLLTSITLHVSPCC